MDAQQAADTVETAVQAVDEIQTIVQTNKAVVVGVAVASAAVGAGIAVLATKKFFETKYERLANEEIEQARLHFKNLYNKPDLSDLVKTEDEEPEEEIEVAVEGEMVREAAKILNEQGYTPYNKPEEVKTQTTVEEVEVKASIAKNIFDSQSPIDTDDYDLDDEYEKRDLGQPWILEKENFFENANEYSQTSLTYFEGDDVLCDEQDRAIRDYEKVIGPDNLHFGRGSGDKNVVYIRNDKLKADYEIVRNQRKYTQEVLGLEDPEDGPRIRRFRSTDE